MIPHCLVTLLGGVITFLFLQPLWGLAAVLWAPLGGSLACVFFALILSWRLEASDEKARTITDLPADNLGQPQMDHC